jgi:hypothetical protein
MPKTQKEESNKIMKLIKLTAEEIKLVNDFRIAQIAKINANKPYFQATLKQNLYNNYFHYYNNNDSLHYKRFLTQKEKNDILKKIKTNSFLIAKKGDIFIGTYNNIWSIKNNELDKENNLIHLSKEFSDIYLENIQLITTV